MQKTLLYLVVFCVVSSITHAKGKLPLSSRIREWLRDTEFTKIDTKPLDSATTTINKRTSPSSSSQTRCNPYGETSNVQITDNGATKAFTWVDQYCSPRPVAVKINAPAHLTIHPQSTILHRCMGTVTHDFSQKCVATQAERIYVTYMDITAYANRNASMLNHTACAEVCIKSQADCNANQTFSMDSCQCECQLNDNSCNSTYQYFDQHNCQCVCSSVQKCSLYREWDAASCSCKCAKCLRKLCLDANRSLEEATCSCS